MLECTCTCAVVTTVEDDIGVIAVKAADDPRALNKTLFIRPKANTLSWNSAVEVWEKKIGHSLHKTYISEAEVNKKVEETSPPTSFLLLAIYYDMSGECGNYPLSPTEHVTAEELFPDYKYITVDEYHDKFV